MKAPMGLGEVMNLLDFGTHPHAAAAQDAFFRIADDGIAGKVLFIAFSFAFKVSGTNSDGGRQPLKFAVAVAFTHMAVLGMIIENEFNNIAAGFPQGLCVRAYLHAVTDRKGTGGHIIPHAFHFDDAHAAGAFDGQFGMIAKPGNMKPEFVSGLHNGLIRLDLIGFIVNRNGNQFAHQNPHSLAIALNLHAR